MFRFILSAVIFRVLVFDNAGVDCEADNELIVGNCFGNAGWFLIPDLDLKGGEEG